MPEPSRVTSSPIRVIVRAGRARGPGTGSRRESVLCESAPDSRFGDYIPIIHRAFNASRLSRINQPVIKYRSGGSIDSDWAGRGGMNGARRYVGQR